MFLVHLLPELLKFFSFTFPHSAAKIRFICTEPLPVTIINATTVGSTTTTIDFKLVGVHLGTLQRRGNPSQGRERLYVLEIVSLGSLSPKNPQTTCKDQTLIFDEEKVQLPDFPDRGQARVDSLHPYCKYRMYLASAIACAGSRYKKEDLVISTSPSNNVTITTLQSFPEKKNSQAFNDRIVLNVPEIDKMTNQVEKGPTTVSYSFNPKFVNDENGPIIAYAIEVRLAKQRVSEFDENFAGKSDFNPNCTNIIYPSRKDNCQFWISKWIPVSDIENAKVDLTNLFTVEVGDLTNSTIPESLFNHAKKSNHDQHEHLDEDHHSHAQEILMSTHTVIATSRTFFNDEPPENRKIFIMALACTQYGCTRAVENYWEAVSRNATFVSPKPISPGMPQYMQVILAICGAILGICMLCCCLKGLRNFIIEREKSQNHLLAGNGVIMNHNADHKNEKIYDSAYFSGKDKGNGSPSSSVDGVPRKPKKIIPTEKPILIFDFAEAIELLTADSEYLLGEEFKDLENIGIDQSTFAAQREANRPKNRYTNILPYDRTRVKIRTSGNEPDESYINANYIAGVKSQREYITTQGPLAATIADFWWLVWENDVTNIIMLCQTLEKGRIKCEQYWPSASDSNKSVIKTKFGQIEIYLIGESIESNWTVRKMRIEVDDRMLSNSPKRQDNYKLVSEKRN